MRVQTHENIRTIGFNGTKTGEEEEDEEFGWNFVVHRAKETQNQTQQGIIGTGKRINANCSEYLQQQQRASGANYRPRPKVKIMDRHHSRS